MKIADMKVTELINAVGSDAPAPGGGAVAGLAGGIGVALTMMVNGLTLSKKGFEDDRERILDAIAKGNELKERFVDVMNRDSEVFDVLIESLALPKENDAQKAIRRGAVQASFRNCTEVPLTMMEVCLESIDLARNARRHDQSECRERPRHCGTDAQDCHAERVAQRPHQPLVPQGQGVRGRVLPQGRGHAGPRHPARRGVLRKGPQGHRKEIRQKGAAKWPRPSSVKWKGASTSRSKPLCSLFS